MKKRVLWWIGILCGLYVLSGAAVWALQDVMLFPGGRGDAPRVGKGVRIDWLSLKDGTKCRYAVAKPLGEAKGAIVFFCGNGEDLSSGVEWARCFAGYGYHALVPEYPGYGASEGSAGLELIHELAEVAATQAKNLVRATTLPLIVGGVSLGSFSAVHVAALGMGDKLILAAPITSVVDVGKQRFPWLPIGWIIRNAFDNISKAGDVKIPALVIHGERDSIIPMVHGQRLAKEMPHATMHVATGKGHNDLWLARNGPLGDLIAGFLQK